VSHIKLDNYKKEKKKPKEKGKKKRKKSFMKGKDNFNNARESW
jgi:hypothetical protein